MATAPIREKETILAEITTLDAAIAKQIAGESFRSFTVGSGEFQRRYSYQEVSLTDLQAYRQSLYSELASLAESIEIAPKFRKSSHMMTSYSKGTS